MANEQTSVPLYVASEILTAANMNISAGTGVPVFATTVTRDAAFGGAGEKVLAEGQLCYLSDSNIVQYYDGAAWATVGPTASGVVQVKSTLKTDAFTTSSTSYVDLTGLSVSITPTSAANKILVSVQIQGTATGFIQIILLRGATEIGSGTSGTSTNSLFALESPNTSLISSLGAFVLDTPATTSATTYKIQAKVPASTGYVNRRQADTNIGVSSSITVFEVTP